MKRRREKGLMHQRGKEHFWIRSPWRTYTTGFDSLTPATVKIEKVNVSLPATQLVAVPVTNRRGPKEVDSIATPSIAIQSII